MQRQWQNIILTAGQIIFVIALIPTLLDPAKKPPIETSLLTGSTLVAFGFVYLSQRWWSACAFAWIMAILWLIIGFQRYQLDSLIR